MEVKKAELSCVGVNFNQYPKDNKTEIASVFDLSEKGGTYQFEKETDGIKQLAK